MPLSALLGFAGVLVAAVSTGLLAGRAVRQPRIAGVLWTAAALALTVALAAQSAGFASGFGPVTFRALQLSGLLLAPLWLAWGLAELTWAESGRFGVRLVCCALTVVGSVILVTDPLAAQPSGPGWPAAALHDQPPSLYAIDAVQVVAGAVAMLSLGLAALRRGRSQPRGLVPAAGLVTLAVLALLALRLSWAVPAAYPSLGLAAAFLSWLGATRPAGPRRADSGLVPAAAAEPASGLVAARAADPVYDRAGPLLARPAAGYDVAGPAPSSLPPSARSASGPVAGTAGGPAAGPAATGPGPGPRPPASPEPPADPGPPPGPGGLGPRPARPYGRLQIFTLLEGRAAAFDRAAEQLAEQVRTREPDTLVFVIHLVPDAPMQRIFYEIYRDRPAFDQHESQPYVLRFTADRRSCVLATNVIELRLKYAKVAPLPGPAPRTAVPQALNPLPPRPVPSAEPRYGTV